MVTDATSSALCPRYAEVVAKLKAECPRCRRSVQLNSDLLRLLLLHQYGGVWADVSTTPTRALNQWLGDMLAPTGFATYRFIPRVRFKQHSIPEVCQCNTCSTTVHSVSPAIRSNTVCLQLGVIRTLLRSLVSLV